MLARSREIVCVLAILPWLLCPATAAQEHTACRFPYNNNASRRNDTSQERRGGNPRRGANKRSVAENRQWSKAEAEAQRSVEEAERLGPSNPRLLRRLEELGELYFSKHRFADAVVMFRKALRIREELPDEVTLHLDLAATFQRLAVSYFLLHNYEQAANYYQRALAIYSQIPEAEGSYFDVLAALAESECLLSRFGEGERYYRELIDQVRKTKGEQAIPQCFGTHVVGLIKLAQHYMDQGHAEKAIPFLQYSLAALRKLPSKSPDAIPTALTELARAYKMSNQLSLYENTLNEQEKILMDNFQNHRKANKIDCLHLDLAQLEVFYLQRRQLARLVSCIKTILPIELKESKKRGGLDQKRLIGYWMDYLLMLSGSDEGLFQCLKFLHQIMVQGESQPSHAHLERMVKQVQAGNNELDVAADFLVARSDSSAESDVQFVERLVRLIDSQSERSITEKKLLAELAKGCTRRQVAQEFCKSKPFLLRLVRGLYRNILHRDVTSGPDINFWVNGISSGSTLVRVRVGFVGSSEALQLRAKAGVSQLNGAYQDLLGRQPTAEEREYALPLARLLESTTFRQKIRRL